MVLTPRLAKQGVKLVSITQPLGDDDDPAQAVMRKVIALFDQYQSKENAKHVLRNMKLNAAQGFWNGPVPLGYVLVEVEKRGTKIKKTLAIDPSMPKPCSLSSSSISMVTARPGR